MNSPYQAGVLAVRLEESVRKGEIDFFLGVDMVKLKDFKVKN